MALFGSAPGCVLAVDRPRRCGLFFLPGLQRDANVRRSLIEQGQLKPILNLMCNTEGPGQMQLCFSMAAALATLVLDVEVMTLVRERGEAPPMFDACLKLLANTLNVSATHLQESEPLRLGHWP